MLRYVLKESTVDTVPINLFLYNKGLFDVFVRVERKEDMEKLKTVLEKTPLEVVEEQGGMVGSTGNVVIPFGLVVRVQAENFKSAEQIFMKWIQGKGFSQTDRDLGRSYYKVFTRVRDKDEAIAFAAAVGGSYGYLDKADYKIITWTDPSRIPKDARFAVSTYVDIDRFGHGVKTQKEADAVMLKKLEDWRKDYTRRD